MGRSDGLLPVLEFVLGEAAETDDAEQPAVLRHREVAEIALEHHLRGFLDRSLGLDRDDALGHPLPHPRLGGACRWATAWRMSRSVTMPTSRTMSSITTT